MRTKRVLGTILVLIVIVYIVSGLKNLSKNGSTTENGNGEAVSSIDYSKLTNQLVYNGQNLDIKIVELNGTYYFPLLELGEKLNFRLNISEDGNMTISDGKNSTVIKSDVTVYINGEEHNKASNFQPVNNYLVPEDFMKLVLGVNFDYSIDEEKGIKYFYMTGRNIYEVNQNKEQEPHLHVYTNEGLRDLGVISSKKDIAVEYDYELTDIDSVVRTDKSDIVTTNYTYTGSVTANNYNVLYVRDGSLIDNTNLKTISYFEGETLSEAPTKTYDNRVAFLNIDDEGKTVIKIYDDATGTLVSEIDTINQYGGQIYNIQAVAKDFLVVGMYGQLYDDSYNSYYTAVINLNTNEVIPMFERFGQFEKLKNMGHQDNAQMVIDTHEVPYDGIIFNFVADDGSLKFSANGYGSTEEIAPETCNVFLTK